MGELIHLFGEPGDAVPLLRRARQILSVYLLPANGMSSAACVGALRGLLMAQSVRVVVPGQGVKSASELICEARAVLRADELSDSERLDALLEILDGRAAQQFAPRHSPPLAF